MNEEIRKIIDKNVIRFINEISSKYNLPSQEIIDKWLSESKKNKNDRWQNFYSKRKAEIKNLHPNMSHTELSKLISTEWNKMNIQEKESYSSKNNHNFEELNKMKMKDLKDICERLNVKKRGNKAQLISNILEKKGIQKPSSPPAPQKDKNDHSLEIYLTSLNKDKRSSIEDPQVEVEDFEFYPDDSENSEEESLIDEDEDQYDDD